MLFTDVTPNKVLHTSQDDLSIIESIFGKASTKGFVDENDNSLSESDDKIKTEKNDNNNKIFIYSLVFFLLIYSALMIDIASRFKNYNKYVLYLMVSLTFSLIFLLFTKLY